MEEIAYAKAEIVRSGMGHVGKKGGAGWDGKGRTTKVQGGLQRRLNCLVEGSSSSWKQVGTIG
jgi:hypothetical protein